jgi:hypothetical protein
MRPQGIRSSQGILDDFSFLFFKSTSFVLEGGASAPLPLQAPVDFTRLFLEA